MIRVCLSGLGRTGKEIAKAILDQKDLKLVSVICSPESDKLGKDLGEYLGCIRIGIIIESAANLEQSIFWTKPNVVIDFSNPLTAIRNAKVLSKMKINIVIGTTGFSKTSLKKLFVLARNYNIGIVHAPNITLGVNVLMLLTNLAANILNNYDFQITEIHHKLKKDIPSGTAVKIAKEIEKGLLFSETKINGTSIPINSVRAGDMVSRHEVMIIGEDDKMEISHESFSRKAFALGAIKAVEFIHKKAGYFEINDVLNLQKVLFDYIKNEGTGLNKKFICYTANANQNQPLQAL